MEIVNTITIKTTIEALYIFEELSSFITLINNKDSTIDVIVKIDSESDVELIYKFMRKLWENGFASKTTIVLGKKLISLEDENVEKELFYCSLTDDMLESYPSPTLISNLIKNYNITKFEQLYHITKVKFSNLTEFDEFDKTQLYMRKGIEFQDNSIIIKNINKLVIYNRYIPYDVEITRAKDITFVNCIITGNIYISDCQNIQVIGCIIKNNIQTIGRINNFIIEETIINSFNITNATVSLLKLCETNIITLTIMHSTLTSMINKRLKVEFLSIEYSKVPKDFMHIAQTNIKSIKPSSYSKKHFVNEEKFFVSFDFSNKVLDKNNKVTASLSTIDILLANAELGTDRNMISNLKYKKNLYSTKYPKKIYIFLTGSFYKPMRFLFYIVILCLLIALVYTFPFNVFVRDKEVIYALTYPNALKYCLEILLNVDLYDYTALGISQTMAVLYKSLNSLLVAGYFSSIVRKLID